MAELSTAMETQIRVAAAQSARDELAKIMGDHVKCAFTLLCPRLSSVSHEMRTRCCPDLYNEGERSRLLRRAYFAVTVCCMM